MSDWAALGEELDRFGASDRVARFWWRDDDAVAATPALDKLLALTAGLPLALAVIPMRYDETLPARLAEAGPEVIVLPHGAEHENHEPSGRKKSEFGASRDADAALRDLFGAMRRLEAGFGPRVRPLFVPPWNRIDPDLAERLGLAGLGALSVFTDRAPDHDGLPRLNTHVDVIDWAAKKQSGTPRFAGEAPVLENLCAALRRRRMDMAGTDPMEPVGILTHHLDHDPETWAFLARLRTALDRHPAACWVTAEEGLAP